MGQDKVDIWDFPTRILFGVNASQKLAEEFAAMGCKRVLVLVSPAVMECGVMERLGDLLRGASMDFQVMSDWQSGDTRSPRDEDVGRVIDRMRGLASGSLMAVGGGKMIDTAKMARLCVARQCEVADVLEETETAAVFHGAGLPAARTQAQVPLVVVPTTAGTGSEANDRAFLFRAEGRSLACVTQKSLMPDVALVDPALTLSLPSLESSSTTMASLTGAVEAYLAEGQHPMADAIARQAIEFVARQALPVWEDGGNLEARSQLMMASCIGAVAAKKGLGVTHAMAHALQSVSGLHHGVAKAICLPAVLDFNRVASPERVARVARIIGVRGDEVETLAFECSDAVRVLSKQIGLPASLEEAGVTEDALPLLASLAFADPIHKKNPRPCSEDDFMALFRASFG